MHLYFTYRSTSGMEMPDCKEYQGNPELAANKLKQQHKLSITPLVRIFNTSTPRRLERLLAFYERWYRRVPKRQFGLQWSLGHTIRCLRQDLSQLSLSR